MTRALESVPAWYREAVKAERALELHLGNLQQETREAIEKSFRLERENTALRVELARKEARLREFETGIALPCASMEEAGKKWNITFDGAVYQCRDSIQLRTLALLLASTPGTVCLTRWLHEAARGESSVIPAVEPIGGEFNAEMVDEQRYASRIGDTNVEGLRISNKRTAVRGDWRERRLYGADTVDSDTEDIDDDERRMFDNVKANLLNARRHFRDKLPALHEHLEGAFAWHPGGHSVSYSPESPVTWSIRWQPH